MRVCHIVSGDLWAGAEVMAWNLLKELQKFPDLEISAALLNDGRLARELRTRNLEVRVFDEAKLSFPRLLLAVRAFMREKSPHIIHSHRYKENILVFFARGAGNGRARLVATNSIVQEYVDEGIELLQVKSRGGKENAQKEAVAVARGEVLVFTDVATRLNPNTVHLGWKRLVSPCQIPPSPLC